MLVRLLVLVIDELLRKLVHKVGCHAHDLCIIHALAHFLVVSLRVVVDVALKVLVLRLHLNVVT